MTARPPPPYGLPLRAWLRADPKPTRWGCNANKAAITAAIGVDAWAWARQWLNIRLILVLPCGENASRFNWRDCAGHDPVLLQSCGEVGDGVVDSLVHALLRDGVERVLDVDSGTEYFAEEVQHAA